MHEFLSYVLSLICEAVLCLELVCAELGQAHYILFFIFYYLCQPTSEDIKQHLKKNAPYDEPVWPSDKALGW